jgi:ferritin-like metal-binding protein YciE
MQHINDLEDLLMHHVKNLYAAEIQIFEAMPSIIKKVQHSSLKNALSHHLGLTQEQKKRLEKIYKLVNEKSTKAAKTEGHSTLDAGYTCRGITGLIEEATEVLNRNLSADVTDSAIIASVQKLEHYEICTYGSALAFAVQLKLHQVEILLRESLDEEYDSDDLLTALATAALNKEALPLGMNASDQQSGKESEEDNFTEPGEHSHKVSISERTINSPGGRAGTSHRRYGSGESRGH